ncbi:MAG: hypothetical protein M3Z05_03645 [Gemmatimonadota bacterium]|nr:hypothetical protein [Gemmatimonadota bacterium]
MTNALRVATGLLILAVSYVLVGLIRRDGPAAMDAWRGVSVQWSWIILASMCAIAGQLIYVYGWIRLLADCEVALPPWPATRMFFASNLGRYLPGGKAWQMGIVGVMAAEIGLPPATLAATSLLTGLVGIGVGMLVLIVTGGAAIGVPRPWVVVPLLGVACVLAAPQLLRLWPRAYAFAVEKWPHVATITNAGMWATVWTSTVNWLFWGLALYLLARGLIGDPGASLSTYVAAWAGPFIAGLVAVFAPAGVGVRDSAMTAVLHAGGLGPGNTLVVVAIARIWATVLEVVPAALVLLARRTGR